GRGVSRGLHCDRHSILRALLIWPIDLRARIGFERFVPHVASDAHDLNPRHIRHDSDPKALADGVFTVEDLAGDPLVDDAYLCPVLRVPVIESAASYQRNPERPEIATIDGSGVDIHQGGLALKLHLKSLHLARERKPVDDAHRFHAGAGLDAIEQ